MTDPIDEGREQGSVPPGGHMRRHRGPHPEDARGFAPAKLPALRLATADLAWLLSRGYALKSALKLVGDRHWLNERQRLAVARASCSDAGRAGRCACCLPVEQIRGRDVVVDGFNLIITLEAALGGGVILVCRDGCLRDLSGVHGTYHAVQETDTVLELISDVLAALAPASVHWLFDSPISNSGRLVQTLLAWATARGCPWTAETVFSPDAVIRASEQIAVTTDSTILDNVAQWTNLSDYVIRERLPNAWLVDLLD